MSHDTSSIGLLAHILSQRSQQSPFALTSEPIRQDLDPHSDKPHTPKPSKKHRHRSEPDNDPQVKKSEPFITERSTKSGKTRFCAQIRQNSPKGPISISKTFDDIQDAVHWRDDTLARIRLGLLGDTTEKSPKGRTIKQLLQMRLDEGRSLERSAEQVIRTLIAHKACEAPAKSVGYKFLLSLSKSLMQTGIQRQTMTCYLTQLTGALRWSGNRGELVPMDEITKAMAVLWDDEILAKSVERNRRPTLDELDKIFQTIRANKRQKLPIILIAVFAIFSCRRLSEICRLRWEDLRESKGMIKVRDMKHPKRKKGNDIWVHLPEEAMSIIRLMPKTSERIFPYNEKSIGTAFRRHRDIAQVIDLRFHDFRHEGITRLYEIGQRDHFVQRTSGHKSRQSLDRYAHVEETGDKYAGWDWLNYALETAAKL